MKIEWLEAFQQTAETKSLTKASEILHISQPALSKQIRNLEDELGTQLLMRSSTGVTLTQTGLILLERSKKIMNDLNEMRKEITLSQDVGKDDLIIGSWPSIATIFCLAVWRLIRRPKVRSKSGSFTVFDMLKI